MAKKKEKTASGEQVKNQEQSASSDGEVIESDTDDEEMGATNLFPIEGLTEEEQLEAAKQLILDLRCSLYWQRVFDGSSTFLLIKPLARVKAWLEMWNPPKKVMDEARRTVRGELAFAKEIGRKDQ